MKYLTVFLIFLAIGITMYVAITTISPKTVVLINGLIQQATTHATNGWNYLQATLGAFGLGLGTMLTAGGSLTLFTLSRLWPKAKENIELEASQKLESVKSSLTQKLGAANSKADDMEQKYLQTQEELATYKEANVDVTSLKQQLESKDNQLKKLRQDYNTMEATLQNTINKLKQEKVIEVR